MRLVGFGCMRLDAVDADRARATLAAAIDAGATLLDTADVYGGSDVDRHGNERRVAEVLRPGVKVATKGGLTRPGGRWVPDGRARSIRAACEGSLRALGRDAIDLYQLHAPDPRVKLATSVRALAKLQRDGLVREIGLCNVTVDQIREAAGHAPIASVQIALSPFEDAGFRSGVAEHCLERGITLLAHSPLGGPKRADRLARDPTLSTIADARGVSPHVVALAWLYDLGAVPLPGATTPEHAREAVAAASFTLDDDERAQLDARFPLGRWLRAPRSRWRPPDDVDGEVVLLMGMPGAGKTTRAAALVERGYVRLNRDERGGTLKKLHRELDRVLGGGVRRVVLDNTYPTRAIRHEVIEVAWRHRLPVRCVWIDTPLDVAQRNAARRMVERHGRLLSPDEIQSASKRDPNTFDPRAQHRWIRALEPPHEEEGYASVERAPFEPAPHEAIHVVELAELATLGDPPAPDRVRLDPEAAERLRAATGSGPVVVIGWLPGADPAALEACFDELRRQLELDVPIRACTHPPGPPRCWCRPPLPGFLVELEVTT